MIREYRSGDFLPLEALARRKKSSGCRISLIIPALNEEKTVGSIVAKARAELLDNHGLLDEIIVMDGGSSDRTASLARDAGAAIYHTEEIAPERHYPPGKGTSLWKSLFVATGDILIYVDADIVDFGPHFVYGLAGALLADPSFHCAKAFYRRPLIVGSTRLEDQGGRVTELLVRPLLSIWYPEVAHMRQPLCGEYAYRRRSLEQIPFSSGYGVEIRLLLGTCRQFGLSSIAQVDMGQRLHRNRTVAELGAMSQAISLEFFRILREEGRISWTGELGTAATSGTPGTMSALVAPEEKIPPFNQQESVG